MICTEEFDVTVVGAGPAGLAAAISAANEGASVLLAERESRLGGILKQCIHDGFGLLRFGEKLSGPEYAWRYINELKATNVTASLLTFVTSVKKTESGFDLLLTDSSGMRNIHTKALILSTGCRERTARQVAIHGTRPAGIFTAGTAQYFTNILGQMPTKRCVILGSGDIGLIMARRLTLEGAEVVGVYEAKPTPSGLTRNIYQCLTDFEIPLYTSRTVTRVFGRERLEAVEIVSVDENMRPIFGTEERIDCDALILSVGLIPENELAESLGIPLDSRTKGPVCDQNYMSLLDGVFVCGNALQVNDLVDYVSESGAAAGRQAALFTPKSRRFASLFPDESILSLSPQKLDLAKLCPASIFFRSKTERGRSTLRVCIDGKSVFSKTYAQLRPPEMERIELDFAAFADDLKENSIISFALEEVGVR